MWWHWKGYLHQRANFRIDILLLVLAQDGLEFLLGNNADKQIGFVVLYLKYPMRDLNVIDLKRDLVLNIRRTCSTLL